MISAGWRCDTCYYSVPEQAWAASGFSSPNPSRLSTPSQLATSHPCVCPYIRAVHNRLVQMQPEVELGGPSALVLGARGVFAAPCPRTGAAKVSVVRIGVAVRQVVEGGR
jgi:hypothetical protein